MIRKMFFAFIGLAALFTCFMSFTLNVLLPDTESYDTTRVALVLHGDDLMSLASASTVRGSIAAEAMPALPFAYVSYPALCNVNVRYPHAATSLRLSLESASPIHVIVMGHVRKTLMVCLGAITIFSAFLALLANNARLA